VTFLSTLFDVEEGRLVDVLMRPAGILDLKLTCRCEPDENGSEEMNGSIGEILPIFKNWQHLRRLTLVGDRSVDVACPPRDLVCNFIWDMTSLTHLCISDRLDRKKIISWIGGVIRWVRQNRPGFSFGFTSSKLDGGPRRRF
jgi:hypothetical protein